MKPLYVVSGPGGTGKVLPPAFGLSTMPTVPQPSQLELWIAASMLRLESRDTAPVTPSLWEEGY